MIHNRIALAALSAALTLSGGNVVAQDESAAFQKRTEIRETAHEALADLYEIVPAARLAIQHAAGYGVFSTFGIKLFFAGGTSGKGMVVDNRTHRTTFMKMLQAQAGLGFGAVKNRLIFVFETRQAMSGFIAQGWEFGGRASLAAAAQREGGSFTGSFSVAPGVYVFELTDTGLSAQLTLAASKFYRDDELH